MTFNTVEKNPVYSRSRMINPRSTSMIAVVLSIIQVMGSNSVAAQYNPQQERRVINQRISPGGRQHGTCPHFIRGERVTDKEMEDWRRNPACANQVREYDKKHGRTISDVR